MTCLFTNYLCGESYSEILPLLIFRVRLVERGSPHSLPLMESGKVLEPGVRAHPKYPSVKGLSFPLCSRPTEVLPKILNTHLSSETETRGACRARGVKWEAAFARSRRLGLHS